uniref:C2H2-type domain-containing protein n=1 Tax=Eptatretus burgeri TaxID=7764 RepID=A0A8C4NB75_EPTBU
MLTSRRTSLDHLFLPSGLRSGRNGTAGLACDELLADGTPWHEFESVERRKMNLQRDTQEHGTVAWPVSVMDLLTEEAVQGQAWGRPDVVEPMRYQVQDLADHSQTSSLFLSRDDPFFEDGDVYRHLYIRDSLSGFGDDVEVSSIPEFGCQLPGCQQRFSSLAAFEHHYSIAHRHTCSICRRRFPTTLLLETHLLEWHDPLFQILVTRENMYRCLVECCAEKFSTAKGRKEHLVRHHGFPQDFRFDQPPKPQKGVKQTHKVTSSQQESGADMEVCSTSSVGDESIAMEVCKEEGTNPLRNVHHRRVPPSICFGHGSVRGFHRLLKDGI